MTLTYSDNRYGDTYTIYIDDYGNFLQALRYVDTIGRDPILYEKLSDLPDAHRNAIEHLIQSTFFK